jgi:hypothetical protein
MIMMLDYVEDVTVVSLFRWRVFRGDGEIQSRNKEGWYEAAGSRHRLFESSMKVDEIDMMIQNVCLRVSKAVEVLQQVDFTVMMKWEKKMIKIMGDIFLKNSEGRWQCRKH